MKRLLRNIVIFAGILLLTKVPFGFFHRDALEIKRGELANGDYNTVFIGSSRTQNSLIPGYFDSQTQGKTKSYNFGLPAGLPPDTFDWAEELFLGQHTIKFAFFELSGLMKNLPVEKLPPRHFSVSKYFDVVASLRYNELQFYHDGLALAVFKPDLPSETRDHDVGIRTEAEKKTLTEKLKLSLERNRRMETSFDGRHQEPANDEYVRRVKELIDIAESRRIEIYFFVPPRLETENEFKTVYPIYQQMDAGHKIDPGHYDDVFYRADMSLDEFHLGPQAAVRFSQKFADAFNARLR
jgi:hypothetical protein